MPPNDTVPIKDSALSTADLLPLLAEEYETVSGSGELSDRTPTRGRVAKVSSTGNIYIADGDAWHRADQWLGTSTPSLTTEELNVTPVAKGKIKLSANESAIIYEGAERVIVSVGSGGGLNDGKAVVEFEKRQSGGTGVRLTEVLGAGVGLEYAVISL